ncbi:MAG: hypothetical protein WBD07_10110 [Vicinamibacterales bacterium]
MISDAFDLANIGPRGQRQRRITGMAGLAVAAVLVGVLYTLDVDRWWRLGAFPLLWLGTLGLAQARARTCVALAARRACDAELAGRGLTDADAEILARRGRAILWRTTAVAAAITLLTLLLGP